jgi:hypothetical protein
MSETVPGVYAAINKVQAELASEGIKKARDNQQQHYKFRGIDDVYNALSSVLAKNGLCIIPRYTVRVCDERQSKSGGVLFYVTVDGEYDIVCAADGSKHVARTYGEAMDSVDKATNKAMSAAYKYLCLQLFCIPTEGDNDADATTYDVAPSRQQPQSARAATAAATREKTQNMVLKSVLAFLEPLDDDTADSWATWMVKNVGSAKPSEMTQAQLDKVWAAIQKVTAEKKAA